MNTKEIREHIENCDICHNAGVHVRGIYTIIPNIDGKVRSNITWNVSNVTSESSDDLYMQVVCGGGVIPELIHRHIERCQNQTEKKVVEMAEW